MRTVTLPQMAPRNASIAVALAALLALALVLALAVRAQVGGERGIAPIAASSDIQVGGVEVNVTGDTPEDAREKGWQEAARLAWAKIDGPQLSDSQLSSIVSAIVIEREQIGPRRYVARLGVVFDRARASAYLGNEEAGQRSAPLLLVPVTFSAGSELVYEQRNPWQRAWAEFQPGRSPVTYVRPSGAGGESLLITYGQTGRRSRTWWRNVLDRFGAADVIVPIADLRYSYPGGPIQGRFIARYGPDDLYLGGFNLAAKNPAELPAMLDQAVLRFDAMFRRALAEGRLTPDPTLSLDNLTLDERVEALLAQARAAIAEATPAAPRAVDPAREGTPGQTITDAPVREPPPEGSVALYTVQAATPDAQSFEGILAAVRDAPGVRAAGIRSTAIGGTSVMTVSFAGSIGDLATALRGRGLTVQQSSSALTVSR